MDEYKEMIRKHAEFSDYKKVRDDKFKHESQSRLTKIAKKKIETTMIGALSSFEEHFGFLWARNQTGGEMTEEQRLAYELYQKVRQEVLDNGNNQARNMEIEINNYEVKWLRYSTSIPVKKIGQGE